MLKQLDHIVCGSGRGGGLSNALGLTYRRENKNVQIHKRKV